MRSQLANLLSGARLGSAIAIVAVAGHPAFVWWLFISVIPSDYLDGLVARRLRIESALGQQLDLAADVALSAVAVYYLVSSHWLPRWAAAGIVIASGGGYFAYRSRLWDLMWVRMIAAMIVMFVYGLEAVGICSKAYGWHTFYLAIAVTLAVPVACIYRVRIVGEFLRVTNAP